MEHLITFLGLFSIQVSTFRGNKAIGSANVWIDSASCKDYGCKNHKQYDGTKFSTYERLGFDLDVEFGTGELVG